MVDPERAGARLARLDTVLRELEAVRQEGLDGYLGDRRLRAACERWLQVAEQVCVDLGAQIAAERGLGPPSDYAAVFGVLADEGLLPADLAGRLGAAARQRNLLVHLYLDIDDRRVFASLGQLDDLRAFAAAVQRLIDEG